MSPQSSASTFRWRAGTAALCVVALAASLGTPVASASAAPAAAGTRGTAGAAAVPAAAATPVVARVGTLATRPARYPVAGAPLARQLRSATVRQDLERERLSATVVLKGTPTASSEAVLSVVFGRAVDGICSPGEFDETVYSTPTRGAPASHFTRDGRTFRLRHERSDAGYQDWDCAFAVISAPDGSINYDGLVGDLTNIHAKPRLRVGKVTQLSSAKRPVKLVRGVWTWLHVTVRNTGPADAFHVRLRGSGKGVKVRKMKVGRVFAEHTKTVRVRVKLVKARKRTTVKLVAYNGVSRDPKRVRAKRVARPRLPKAGKYRNKNGRVRFRIRDRKVVGFRAFALTTCGAYPDAPTTSVQWYGHPRTRIPRDGLLDDEDRHENFVTHLELKSVGRTVTRGKFLYWGPANCRAWVKFSARRR